MGSVPCTRAYYYCGRCGGGLAPWDRAVGLTARSFTPATERLVCLAGTLSDGFEEASTKVLPEMAGLKVAETTVQRTTEAAGQRVADHLHAGSTFAFPHHWKWHKDARGRTCAYVGLDLTGVRQQAKNGGKAEGRMPYVAMVFNPVPELPADAPHQPPAGARMQARYLSGLYDLDQLGRELRKQAGQVGMDQAEVWIGLTDGGNGLEEFVRRNFPRDPVLILDFWHASEYLTELGQALYPADEEARQRVVGEWCRTLRRRPRPGDAANASRAASAGSAGEIRHDVELLPQQRASHGLPDLRRQRLVDRLGRGRVGLQDGRRPAPKIGGHALARIRHRHGLPSPSLVQERQRPMASLLASCRPANRRRLNIGSTNGGDAYTRRLVSGCGICHRRGFGPAIRRMMWIG
jgi:hypothetical protein